MAAVCGLATGPSAAAADEPWGYEQVTPVEKGGGAVSTLEFFQASPDGGRLLHSSMLPYSSLPVASAPVLSKYVATRTPTGWENVGTDPLYRMPQDPVQSHSYFHGTVATSPNLEWAVVVSRVPLTPGADPEGGGAYLKNIRTGELKLIYTTDREGWRSWETGQRFTAGLLWLYVANDGKSVLFRSYEQLGPLTDDAPEVPGGGGGLYSWTEEEGLRYEAKVDGVGVQIGITPGAVQSGARSTLPLDNHGLDHVYFQANSNSGPAYVSEGPPGARTSRLISYSRLVEQPEPPAGPVPTPAQPLAAGAGGRYALLVTGNNTPLAGGEPAGVTSQTRFLYRFDAEAEDPADELEYIGLVPSNPRVVQMSQDGRTVAFYSTHVQAGAPAGSQQKLYVWREGEGLTYVYSADAGSLGTSNTDQLRRLSDNGRYLAFTDDSPSLAAQFGMDDNVAAACPNALRQPGPCGQVYRYDVETGDFDCASCRSDGAAPLGHSGHPGQGAGSTFLNAYQVRTIANDGTVFFTSRDALVEEDRNSLNDAYAWHPDTGARLLSPATPGQAARFIDASADGKVAFIGSRERLAPSDKDNEEDVYATFAGAGFAAADADGAVADCVGGDCRGALDAPAAPSIATESYTGRGNVKPSRRVTLAVSAPRAATGRVAVLRVRVPAAGRVALSGRQVRNSRRAVGGARTVKVRVVLTRKARRALARRNRIAVRVRVAFAPRSGRAVTKTVRLVFAKPSAKGAASVTKGGR